MTFPSGAGKHGAQVCCSPRSKAPPGDSSPKALPKGFIMLIPIIQGLVAVTLQKAFLQPVRGHLRDSARCLAQPVSASCPKAPKVAAQGGAIGRRAPRTFPNFFLPVQLSPCSAVTEPVQGFPGALGDACRVPHRVVTGHLLEWGFPKPGKLSRKSKTSDGCLKSPSAWGSGWDRGLGQVLQPQSCNRG